MAHVLVAVASRDVARPRLELGRVHFDYRAAVATGQMVMVGVDDAAAKEAFATVGHDHVDLAALDEFLQLRVDRRECDAAAVANDESVEFLGTDESLDSTEETDDLSALGRISCDRHPRSVPVLDLLLGIILIIVVGMVLRKPIFLMVLFVVALGIFVIITFASISPGESPVRPVIVSGVTQWAALATQIAGPDATVISLLSDPNADPHDHEATTSDAAHVAAASVVIENGAGYDTWLSKLVQARTSPPHVVDVATLMNVTDGSNPHLFYDLSAATRLVHALQSQLVPTRVYPGVAKRSAALLDELSTIQQSVAAIRHSCANVRIAATEDVAGYLLNASGLRVVTPETLRLAIGNSVDPSVQGLALALNQIRARPAFLVNNVQTATPLTNEMVRVAKTSHVTVIDVTETMKGTNYVQWMNGVLTRIRAALVHEGCLS